jgi:Sulfotransferase family
MAMQTETADSALAGTGGFKVTWWLHVLGGLVSRHPRLWTRLGNLETLGLNGAIAAIDVRRPVYIAGLARSGSTLLLEVLNRHPELSAHQYRDYPMLFTPYLWNRYLERTPQSESPAVERTHRDGIFITPESPEAFEEVLWMRFFTDLHNPSEPAVLDEHSENPAFERFYRDHIRKLLLIRGGRRYLSKDNYNITRLAYLLKLFPDARILIPVREPIWHIASLIRQHRLFSRGQQAHPRALAHLNRVGHFEFGLNRRPIHAGNRERLERIAALWGHGDEVAGWAHYWAYIHDYLADCLEADRHLRQVAKIVHYEALCATPQEGLRAIFAHCGLPVGEEMLRFAQTYIRPIAFRRPDIFSDADLAVIQQCTHNTAARFAMGRYNHFSPEAMQAPVQRSL